MSRNLNSFSLEDFCRTHRVEEKIIVVPSYRVGHQIGESLAAQGVPWVNMRFLTLPGLADGVAGPEVAARGWRHLTGAAALFLVESIFRDLKIRGELDYFDALETGTGIVKAILKSIRALRMAGIQADELKPKAFVDERKGREVALFLKRFEQELERRHVVDLAGMYGLAIELLERKQNVAEPAYADQEDRFYICFHDSALHLRDIEFLKKLAGDRLVCVPRGRVEGLELPRRDRKNGGKNGDSPHFFRNGDCPHFSPHFSRFPDAGGVPDQAPTPRTDLQRLPWLFTPETAPPPFKDGTVQFFSATGPSNECREVLRQILQAGYPLDEVEVVHPPGSGYPVIFYLLSAKAGLKMTFSEGVPLGFTAPGKVFHGLFEWLANDFLSKALSRMLESGAIRLPAQKSVAKPSALRAARHLKNALIGWGRDRYLPRLKSWEESLENQARLLEEEGEVERSRRCREGVLHVRWLCSAVKEMLGHFPLKDEHGRVDLGVLCLGMAQFLKKYTCILNDLDGEALGILTTRLEEAAAVTRSKIDWDQALIWLQGLGEGMNAGASGPLPGHMFVSGFDTGAYSGRPVTFVVGLDQGAFPGAGLQDPILLDEERERISKSLPATADILRENLFSMAGLLSSLRGRVVLSYSDYDIIDERASFPSSVLLQAHRLLEGDADLDYTDLLAALPQASGMLPGGIVRVFDEIDWWLAKLAPGGRFLEGRTAVRMHFPALHRGVLAWEARDSEFLTEFDGQVDVGAGEFHPFKNPDIVMSASRLELLAGCPYGYFLNYVLGIAEPDELEYDPSRWLDPLQRGTLLHEIFQVFMQRAQERGEVIYQDRHGTLIQDIADECIQRTRRQVPPPSEGIFQRERKELLDSLQVFLATEAQRARPVEPVLFEASFGMKSKESRSMEEPVEILISRGNSLRVRGKIDRVDRLEENRYRVIDYKTGSYAPFEDIVCFGRGRALQHVLYSVAAEKMLAKLGMDAAPRVVESGYYFPTRRGEGREILFQRRQWARWVELLQVLLTILEQGNFLIPPDAKCTYCDYAPVCGTGATDRTAAKVLRNPDEYAAWERLKDFE
jgi:ATP-dependent helicase/nuclease subunit B